MNDDELSPEAIDLADQAVARWPESAELWILRGDLIQLAPAGSPHELEDALHSYERATQIAPSNAEAWESLGYYHDVHTQNLEAAETAFRRAVENGGGPWSWSGLARVLVQRGTPANEVLALLEECPHASSNEVKEIAAEIRAGTWG